AAFHRHRHRDLRVLGRSEADEQRAVAQVHGQAARIDRAGAAAADHLRGTGLAGHPVRRADAYHARGAAGAVDGHLHALAHHPQVVRALADLARFAALQRRPRRVEAVAARLDQVRPAQVAIVGEGAGGAHHLQRGDLPVALADGDVHGVARIPALLALAQLPRRAGQDAGALAHQVDAGRLAEAVAGQVLLDPLDAHVQRQLVVVRVDRVGDRLARIGPAVAAAVRVAPAAAVAGQVEHAGGQGAVLGAAHAA